ncbi:MAG: carboxymuconolactone decarboxylase family protein [Planctomycetota bacterium]|nr:carboxymuconolactone decarboxylase family protein [Planctomycetota bacterium]
MGRYEQFQEFRSKMNSRILGDEGARGKRADGTVPMGGTLVTKRFFTLDGQAYQAGALDVRTKELMGLVASAVLRCDDCIAYHIDQAVKSGASDEQIFETLDIALIVGGSIVIPHLRRAVEFLDATRDKVTAGEIRVG